MKKLHRIPEISELAEIPIPHDYKGQDPIRIRDFLTGFQIAYELALRLQLGQDRYEPRDDA